MVLVSPKVALRTSETRLSSVLAERSPAATLAFPTLTISNAHLKFEISLFDVAAAHDAAPTVKKRNILGEPPHGPENDSDTKGAA